MFSSSFYPLRAYIKIIEEIPIKFMKKNIHIILHFLNNIFLHIYFQNFGILLILKI